ncbi:hypothetical protein CLAFUR4_08778 [Fulvia fulva]|uniref:Uncharacterized protein n=1 Tax=Passalora fulva TaxID=5499 RepID=A0A9Q8UTS5_PASFU|nr:hypothetical protein CLAFUR4_08778 [Fulvia fulva]WPV35488.1 hypothetical protein CLAFUW7_08773 [Fulvia fulva]
MLLTALLENDLAGHVFHDLDWVDKVSMPSPATYAGETTPIGQDSPGYKAAYKKWKISDIKAFGCITSRLDPSIRPNFGEADKSAKELYDTIATTWKPVATIDLYDAMRSVNKLKLDELRPNTLRYCESFQSWVHNHRIALDQFIVTSQVDDKKKLKPLFVMPDGYYRLNFVEGLNHVEWLRTWRHNNPPETTSLETMISTLRREQVLTSIRTGLIGGAFDDEDLCTQCTHKHTNANCFKQHPEKNPRSKGKDPKKGKTPKQKAQGQKGKGKGKAAAAVEDDDQSESDTPQKRDAFDEGEQSNF